MPSGSVGTSHEVRRSPADRAAQKAYLGTFIEFKRRGIWHIQFGIANRAATDDIAAAILWNGTTGVGGQTDAATTIINAVPQYLAAERVIPGTAGVYGPFLTASLPVSEWDLARSNPSGLSVPAKLLRFVEDQRYHSLGSPHPALSKKRKR